MIALTECILSVDFDQWFVSAAADNHHYRQQLTKTVNHLSVVLSELKRAGPSLNSTDLNTLISPAIEITNQAQSFDTVLIKAMQLLVKQSVYPHHPHCCAHLHCPPMIPAIAAEIIIATLNQSMDSWDQSPSATLVETHLLQWLCGLIGWSTAADGTITSGGTQANLMGLLLARDHTIAKVTGSTVQQSGLPADSYRYKILCAETTHFSISKSAALLGLGRQAIITIATQADGSMCPQALSDALTVLHNEQAIPLAIVATVGTTDLGSIDALTPIADIAQQHQCWLHVDAAYGGALLLSAQHAKRLEGIDRADSITVDFHKLFFQPISCGALLVKSAQSLSPVCFHADYLSRPDDEEPNLVDKSLATTRRFDALKLWFSLQTVGKAGFSAMLDKLFSLTQYTYQSMQQQAGFNVLCKPQLTTVLFQLTVLNQQDKAQDNHLHQQLRRQLLHSGKAVIAETKIKQKVWLKITLLNPCADYQDIDALLVLLNTTANQLYQQTHRVLTA